ncbi:histone-lysine N-methyltransferase SETMAR [Trichonephila clavipes]|nr:histone-lysine N-methyltransferase SETMAR [Trichonephila clavipes]
MHNDNARPHIARCVLNVSQQNNEHILPHLLYSSELTPFNFWLLPQLKKPLRGKRFASNKACSYCRTHNLLQVPIAELAERWTELPQVSDESRSFFRVHTGYFSNIPKCIKAEFIASWACSQSSVVSSSQR